jgi:hypothetical protein
MTRRRDGAAATAAPPKPAAAKAKPKPKAKAAAKPKPTAAAKPKPAKPKVAAAKPKAAAGPRAVRSGSPSLKTPEPKDGARRAGRSRPPKGPELITTAVQATGELAQIGLTLGARAVKRAVKRLPKP